MHETGVIRSLISEVERVARRYGSPRVRTVRVRIGALCPLSEDHLREHFSYETRGTVAERARLVVEQGTNPTDPLAQDVVLDSIELEDVLPVVTRVQNVSAI
jgi:hydrogenase nickel incorporation protein HypA/HybF